MPEEPKRPARASNRVTPDGVPEKVARLRRQTHGVIDGKAASALPLSPAGQRGAPDLGAATLPAAPQTADDATVPMPFVDDDQLTGETPPPLPPSPASAAAEVWLEEAATRPSAFTDLTSGEHSMGAAAPNVVEAPPDPIDALREAHAQATRSLRIILVLSTITAFTVGLVLGALLFRGRSAPPAPAPAGELCAPP